MTVHRRVSHDAISAPVVRGIKDRRSAVQYRLGGRNYNLVDIAHCKVCKSPYRIEIEQSLIKSYGYTAIWKSLPEQGQTALSVRNITDHAKNHLPLEEGVRHSIVRLRAKEIGVDIEGSESALIDYIGFARAGLQDVFEGIREGRLHLDTKDGIALANLLAKIDEKAGDEVEGEVMDQAFMEYLKAIRAVCSGDQVKAIGARLSSSPVMKAIWANQTAEIENVEYEDAEIVDER